MRRAYAAKVGATYSQGHLTPAMQEAYGSVAVFPTIFVVDGKGTIVKHFVNAPTKEHLEAAIRAATAG